MNKQITIKAIVQGGHESIHLDVFILFRNSRLTAGNLWLEQKVI